MAYATKKNFRTRPDHLIEDFQSHLKTKGTPHTWQHHTHVAPSPEDIVVLLPNFSVPDRLRSKVGKAPCPICSIGHPKYFGGHLLWSPVDGTLHAVGHCCGDKHFHGNTYAISVRAAKKRVIRIRNETLIEANWQRPELFKKCAEGLASTAKNFDFITRQIRLGLTDKVARSLYQSSAETGYLTVSTSLEKGTALDSGLRSVNLKFGKVPLKGASVFRGGVAAHTLGPRLYNTVLPFQWLGWKCQDDCIEWLMNQSDENLAEMVKYLTFAEKSLAETVAQINELTAFLEPTNLTLLNEWFRQPSVSGKCSLFLRPDNKELKIWRNQHLTKTIKLKQLDVSVDVPALKWVEPTETDDS